MQNAPRYSGSVEESSVHSTRDKRRIRVAVVVSHPIQYYAPWFANIVARGIVDLKVFYLWNAGVVPTYDRDFGHEVVWDIPLLEGYEHEFVPNVSRAPGTHRFSGLNNPALIGRIESWKPDAILLFGYAYASLIRALLDPRLAWIPMLMRGDSHDLCRIGGIRSFLKRIVRQILFRRFSAFLSVGIENARYFRNAGVPASRIYFVPHCVDNSRFAEVSRAAVDEFKRELGIDAGAPVVLFAGKLERKKRPTDLLEAFCRIGTCERRSSAPGPVLLFVGAGSLEDELRRLANGRIGRDIFFAPFQNQSQMPAVYSAGDVFVLPSGDETWGLAVNEAMSSGCPAIVSSHVGCGPDLVTDGQTGWMYKAGDVDALCRTLAEALCDLERLASMGQLAKRRVSGYSYDAATEGFLAALAGVTRRV